VTLHIRPAVRALRVLAAVLGCAAAAASQPRNESVHVTTITATVERLHRAQRAIVCRLADGARHTLMVDEALAAAFDALQEGDAIEVAFIEALVVAVKPGARPTDVTDTTADARSRVVDPLVDLRQQLTAVVTIDTIDRHAGTVVYHGRDGRRVLRAVRDPRLLDGLAPGAVVEITLTRERAVRIDRAPR
jgi:hypothetical protein